MEEITTYIGSDGKETPISELNPFHLVNAMLKTHQPTTSMDMHKALKAEVLKRLTDEGEEEEICAIHNFQDNICKLCGAVNENEQK